jgi:hypothetical protein
MEMDECLNFAFISNGAPEKSRLKEEGPGRNLSGVCAKGLGGVAPPA